MKIKTLLKPKKKLYAVWILLVLAPLLSGAQKHQQFDILFVNGKLMDGTGNP